VTPNAACTHASRRLWNGLLDVDHFVRMHFLFFSGLLPLLGASTIRRELNARQIAALLGVALCFHVYSYVLNDVIDLPIDRTQPRRWGHPLVRGAVRPWQALMIALVQPVLTIPFTIWLGGGGRAHATLAAGFSLMAAYNLWGKRCLVPPVTDLLQGFAWGSLVVYGAQAIGGEPNGLTWMAGAYAAGFILFINGVHGGLRDLENDIASGARTTAVFFGARPSAVAGAPFVPRAVAVFASSVLAGLTVLIFSALLRNDFGYSRGVLAATGVAVGVLQVAAFILMPFVVRTGTPTWEIAFRAQLYVVMIALPVAFLPYLSIATILVLLVLTLISLLPFRTTHVVVRSMWYALRSTHRSVLEKTFDRRIARTGG
jgi:4-hydroxybenzoate polyprenyltransferase